MSKDPFYEQILAGLSGTLNPQDFEDCMADLLREMFPTLVPVHGGKDSGMDGAIADGEGEPFPLVVTTGEDVERNLQGSLDSFAKRKQPPRKVVFATSQALTPQRRLKLMDLARERDFTLIQVIDQRGVANLLLKSPRWYKQLLSLSGQPSALSVIPRSRRPLLDLEPIGRTGDLEWLQQTTGDRVLSGEPGSGKTFLLYYLARQGWGLFLVDPDGDIAGALREQRPEIVIVDDAHAEPGVLEKLRHLQQTGMDFSIVATTWEGARNEVIEAMGGIPEDKVRKLELLTRAEILEVFRSAGVEEDAGTMRYLIDQAANKPGLAVTIATLWLAGSWREVIEGNALSRTLLAFFNEFVGPETTDVLAAFSLGGDRGMGVEAVREFLGLSRLKIRQIAAGLAAGGVLSEVDKDTLAVWPRPLRSSLIRTVFFPPPGQPRYPYLELVKQAPKYDKALSTLIAAKSLGVNVPEGDLRDLVARSTSPDVWSNFARLSSESAKWVLDHYPGNLLGIAAALLHRVPRLVIPRIFDLAASFSKTKESRPESAMSILSAWVREISAGPQEWIGRREMVGIASKEYLLGGGEPGIGVYGISIALSPAISGSNPDPGIGDTVTMRWGLMSAETLWQLGPIWDKVKDALRSIDAASWQYMTSLLWDWTHPEYVAKRTEISEETRLATRAFVENVLTDLIPFAEGSPGIQAGLNRLAAKLELDLGLGQDDVFELLYPAQDTSTEETRREMQESMDQAVRKLAAEWAEQSPQEVADRVAFYEREAQLIGHDWLQNTAALCQALAEEVDQPEKWLEAFLGKDLRRHLLSPFLERIVDLQRTGWETRIESYLDREPLGWTALSLVLKLPHPPPALLDRALTKVEANIVLVETLCLQRRVPLPTLRKLFLLPSWESALAAAVGEWCANPQREVREEVRPEWRSVILRSKTREFKETRQAVGLQYWLRDILDRDANLALNWLRCRLKDSDLPQYFTRDSPFMAAIKVLREEQREELLGELQPARILRFMLPVLIDSDLELYRKLLEIESLKDYHLGPLGGLPSRAWMDLAVAALDAGYAPEVVANAAFLNSIPDVSTGLKSGERWDQAFAALENHPRRDFQEVVRLGRAWAQEELGEDLKRQRRFELYGLGREE